MGLALSQESRVLCDFQAFVDFQTPRAPGCQTPELRGRPAVNLPISDNMGPLPRRPLLGPCQ